MFLWPTGRPLETSKGQHPYDHFPRHRATYFLFSANYWLQLFRTSKVERSFYQVHQADELRLNELFLETSIPYVKMFTPAVYRVEDCCTWCCHAHKLRLRTESFPLLTMPRSSLKSL